MPTARASGRLDGVRCDQEDQKMVGIMFLYIVFAVLAIGAIAVAWQLVKQDG